MAALKSKENRHKEASLTATGHEDVRLPIMAVLRSHHSCGSLDLTLMDIYQGHIHYLLYLLDLGLFTISGYERMSCCPLYLWY
jgi:hypothetical protein